MIHSSWTVLSDIAFDIGHGTIKNIPIKDGVPSIGNTDNIRPQKLHPAWDKLAELCMALGNGTVLFIKVADAVPVMAVFDYPTIWQNIKVERQERLV